jgi:hypothetical protein
MNGRLGERIMGTKKRKFRLHAAIGKRLQETLKVDFEKLPSVIAEKLKLLDLKVRGRFNGHGR